jgi:hypothetical protein
VSPPAPNCTPTSGLGCSPAARTSLTSRACRPRPCAGTRRVASHACWQCWECWQGRPAELRPGSAVGPPPHQILIRQRDEARGQLHGVKAHRPTLGQVGPHSLAAAALGGQGGWDPGR